MAEALLILAFCGGVWITIRVLRRRRERASVVTLCAFYFVIWSVYNVSRESSVTNLIFVAVFSVLFVWLIVASRRKCDESETEPAHSR